MTKFILVRHAQSEANRLRIFAGHSDFPLSKLGFLQAKCSAEFSKNYKIDAIYSSDLSRAYSTAEAFGAIHNLPIIKEKQLREIDAGEWDSMTVADIEAQYGERYSKWRDGTFMQPVGGESPEDLAKRIYNILEKIANQMPDKTVLIATHAAAIRAFETFVKKGDMAYLPEFPWVTNASHNFLEYRDNKFTFGERDVCSFLGELKSKLPPGI